MAIKIIEKNGRKYGYGINTIPAEEAELNEIIDLAWLNATISANVKLANTKKNRRFNRKKDYSSIIKFLLSGCGIIGLFYIAVTFSLFKSLFGIAMMCAIFAVSFVFMKLIKWDSKYYERNSDTKEDLYINKI